MSPGLAITGIDQSKRCGRIQKVFESSLRTFLVSRLRILVARDNVSEVAKVGTIEEYMSLYMYPNLARP